MARTGSPGTPFMNSPWVQGSNPFTVSESTPFAPGQLGKISFVASGGTPVDTGLAPIAVQAVKRYTTDTVTSPKVGALAYWQDLDNYVVTGDIALAIGGSTSPLVAGVFGSTNLSWGSYGFIQVGGVAPLLMNDSTACAAGKVGLRLIFAATSGYGVTPATNASADIPSFGLLSASTTATGTPVTVEALLQVFRNSW